MQSQPLTFQHISLTRPQGGSQAQPQGTTSATKHDGDDSSEEWENIGYEETEEGRKATHMAYGHFQIKRKKKRIFSYHWNVRKY